MRTPLGTGGYACVEYENGFAYKKPRRKDDETQIFHEYNILYSMPSHKNIIEVKRLIYEEGVPLLVCDFGGNAIIDMLPFDPSIARHLFQQVMEGLAFMHSQNVVHLDLKLDNIVCDDSGRVRLIDFGFARRVSDTERRMDFVRSALGSVGYCCPEAIAGASFNGFEADFWAAGVVAFALAVQRLPWRAASKRDSRFAKFVAENCSPSQYFSFLAEFPPWAANAVDMLLHVDPKRRSTAWFPPRAREKKILLPTQGI